MIPIRLTHSSTGACVTALIEALGRETDLCRKLAPILEQERACLVTVSQTGLLQAVHEKEFLLTAVRTQAHEVTEAMKALAASVGLSERDSITLSRLGGLLSEPSRTLVLHAQAKLTAAADTVRRSNGLNDRLIHHSMAYIAQSLSMLRGPSGSVSYQPSGAAGASNQSGRLVALRG